MEVPSLWKDFVWPNYEPLPVRSVSKILEAQGRRIFFPAHLTSANILEMVQCCTKVTHLRNLSLDHLEEIVLTMKHLQQLDVSVNGAHMESRLLATAAGVTLRYESTKDNLGSLKSLLEGIKQQGNSLPSVINVYDQWICAHLSISYYSFGQHGIPNYRHLKLACMRLKSSNESLSFHTTNEGQVWSSSNTSSY